MPENVQKGQEKATASAVSQAGGGILIDGLNSLHAFLHVSATFLSFFLSFQEAVVSCWVQFSDGAVTPLELFDRSIYTLTVSTPDEEVATVRRTPQSTFVVARGEGEGQGALVRAELRICEECQKSKRKSKLAAGTGLLRINIRSDGRAITGGGGGVGTGNEGDASELIGEPEAVVTSRPGLADWDRQMLRSAAPERREADLAEPTTTTTFLTTKYVKPQVVWIGSATRATRGAAFTIAPTAATTTESTPGPGTPPGLSKTDPTVGLLAKGEGQKRNFGNMLDDPNLTPRKAIPKVDLTLRKEPPRSTKTSPKLIESDLIRTFRAMSDLEIGMYALAGVSCVAIFAFLFNCALYNLCFRSHKTPVQAGLAPIGDPKDHKHNWVWLGSDNHGAPTPGGPAQVATLKREAHRPLLPRCSVDSTGYRGLEGDPPRVSVTAVPERTATLGRSRSSSQQHVDPLASRSATLLAKPQRSEPLHSPTSKRNQVQFTTFTTLDIKHLAALKKNGVELNWAQQQTQQQHQVPAGPQTPLPDMPWPVVKPVGQPQ